MRKASGEQKQKAFKAVVGPKLHIYSIMLHLFLESPSPTSSNGEHNTHIKRPIPPADRLQNKNNAMAVAVCVLGEYLRVHVLKRVGVVTRKGRSSGRKQNIQKVGLACFVYIYSPVILAGYAATRRHGNGGGGDGDSDGDHQCCVSWVEMV